MLSRKQDTRLPWNKDWEKHFSHKRAHTLYSLFQHSAPGEEQGPTRCEEEGLFPVHCTSTNHPICCNPSLL